MAIQVAEDIKELDIMDEIIEKREDLGKILRQQNKKDS